MKTYWLTFTDGTEQSCQGQTEYDAKQIAEKLTGKTVAGGQFKDFSIKSLPYPSEGCVWKFEHPIHGKTPSFCYGGKKCAGRTACPQNYSCTE
jgi:hypothetical protein